MHSRPLPHRHPFSDFFSGEGVAVQRLSETDNPSLNCPSILTDKVRRIVHSISKPFPFQIKTYYLSDAYYQTDNLSHIRLLCENGHFCHYYIHLEITGYPWNLIGSQQCDLFLNRTIFCSKSRLFQVASFMF